MKKLLLELATTIFVCSAGLTGCAKSEISNSGNSVLNQSVNNKQISEILNVKVDASLQNVASNFQKKLEYYNGNLISLTLTKENINAEWNSKKCNWFKEEIIDLAISINRGYTDSVKGITAQRTCNSDTKKFSVSGDKFDKYKSGQISDSQFAEGIK